MSLNISFFETSVLSRQYPAWLAGHPCSLFADVVLNSDCKALPDSEMKSTCLVRRSADVSSFLSAPIQKYQCEQPFPLGLSSTECSSAMCQISAVLDAPCQRTKLALAVYCRHIDKQTSRQGAFSISQAPFKLDTSLSCCHGFGDSELDGADLDPKATDL